MLEHNIFKIEKGFPNKIIIKHISLDYKLDFFMVIDSNDENYANIIENKILDFIIDKISIKWTYKDFSLALEKINGVIKSYDSKNDDENQNDRYLNILVSILNKDDFIFSNIWSSSLYLIKETNETIEITDKNENKKEFSYIFEWKLEHLDILVMAPSRLLDYLSYSDFTDSVSLGEIDKINKNIELILGSESLSRNIWSLAIRYSKDSQEEEKKNKVLEKFWKIWLRLIDNNLTKLSVAYFKIFEEWLDKKSMLVKNLLLVSWIFVASILLFQILSWAVSSVSKDLNNEENLVLLENAKRYKTTASDNYTNPELFNLNIESSEDIIRELKDKKIFLDDIKVLEEQIAVIKKTFNRVEQWQADDKNLINKIPYEYVKDFVKILRVDKKLYLVTKNLVVWPILNDQEAQSYSFEELGEDEYIDVTELKWNLILLTRLWKVIEFRQSGSFSFRDVLNQDTWQEARRLKSYANNIYLVWWEINQVFKHSRSWNNFKKAEPYLKKEDMGDKSILSIAIDGWIYMLRDDLSIIKFYSSPYRIENIVLNDLPDNYKRVSESNVEMIARNDLNYIYMLLEDKIWIFKPNTRFYKQTTSMKYLWQIESRDSKIIWFFVEKDWVITVVNQNGIYDISFSENEEKILLNN